MANTVSSSVSDGDVEAFEDMRLGIVLKLTEVEPLSILFCSWALNGSWYTLLPVIWWFDVAVAVAVAVDDDVAVDVDVDDDKL